MACTLISSPPDAITAARNPLQWQFTSDTANIRMLLCEPVIDSAPQPVQPLYPTKAGQFIFDAGRYLEDALWAKAADNGFGIPLLLSTSIEALPWHTASCYLRLFEVYGDTIPYTDNYELNITDYTTAELTALLMDKNALPEGFTTGSPQARFLNNAPATLPIALGEYELQGIYNSSFSEFVLERYTHTGATLERRSWPMPVGVATIPTGPANLEPGLLDNCVAYAFWIQNLNGERISEIKKRVLRQQPVAVQQRIHWVNKYGMPDSYTFTGFRNRMSRWNRDNSLPDRTDLTELATGFEPQETNNWLFEMLSAPYLCQQQGQNFIPVVAEDKEKTCEDLRVRLPVFSATFRYI